LVEFISGRVYACLGLLPAAAILQLEFEPSFSQNSYTAGQKPLDLLRLNIILLLLLLLLLLLPPSSTTLLRT